MSKRMLGSGMCLPYQNARENLIYSYEFFISQFFWCQIWCQKQHTVNCLSVIDNWVVFLALTCTFFTESSAEV